MPSPPRAPRRVRTAPSHHQGDRQVPQRSAIPNHRSQNIETPSAFDSSDDSAWEARVAGRGGQSQRQVANDSASFTFGGGAGPSNGSTQAAVPQPSNLFAPSRAGLPFQIRQRTEARPLPPDLETPSQSHLQLPDTDQLLASLTSQNYRTNSEDASQLAGSVRPSGPPMLDPRQNLRQSEQSGNMLGIAGPSRIRLGPSQQGRLSNSSSFASSPGPLRRIKTGGGAGTHSALPSTPTGARLAGMNADGSFSVIRDQEDANNSGLLDLGPQSSLGRNGDLFGFKRARGIPIRKTRQHHGTATDAFDDTQPRSRLSDPPFPEADSSIVDHLQQPNGQDGQAFENEHGIDLDDVDEDEAEGNASLLRSLRLWRQDAMEHHLYDTAIFWGEKIVCMEVNESQRCNDAYFLAKAYFLTHQYSRAEKLLMTPLPSNAAVANLVNVQNAGNTSAEEEGLADEDALRAAVESTRKGAFLPEHLLESASRRPPLYGGFLQRTNDSQHRQQSSASSAAAERKRKDREFTVSGTGTGSESDPGEAGAENGSDGKGQPATIETNADGVQPRVDFRRGHSSKGSEPGGRQANSTSDAWREEQLRSLHQVQAHHHASITQKEEQVDDDGSTTARGKPLVDISAVCRFLAAKCMVRLGQYGEALDLIGEESGRWIKGHNAGKKAYGMPSSDGLLKVGSSMSHLRGLIHLRLDDLDSARAAFLDALRLDVKNYDAFSTLIDSRLIESKEVWSLIESLQWEAQSNGDRQSFDFIRLCYTARLGKEEQSRAIRAAAARRALWDMYGGSSASSDGSHRAAGGGGGGLYNSVDLLYALAEDLHARRRFSDALIVTRRILDLDSEHEQTLDLHISSIASLSPSEAKTYRPELFLLANRLVDEHPDRATSWFAVGTWYSSCSRWTEARVYFSKATLLNPRHFASWISFAHSFSMEGESDQAILAYSSVTRNFPDDQYAKICLGAEHLKLGNIKLARVFLEGGASTNGEIGQAEVEMGVLLFYEGKYSESITLLLKSLQAFEAMDEPDSTHLTTRLNLAWAYRKNGQLNEARSMFHSVIEIEAENLSALLGLGMVDHGLGNIADAVGWYHEVLCIDPRHPQATDLLENAMEEYARLPISNLLNLPSALRDKFPPETRPAIPMDSEGQVNHHHQRHEQQSHYIDSQLDHSQDRSQEGSRSMLMDETS
ncbi:unnamed protein product [Sympodiomycopsis kandeliae]